MSHRVLISSECFKNQCILLKRTPHFICIQILNTESTFYILSMVVQLFILFLKRKLLIFMPIAVWVFTDDGSALYVPFTM